MSFFIGYINGGIVGIVLVLIAFFLQGSIRKREHAGTIAKIISAIGAIGSLYFIYLNAGKLIAAVTGQTSPAVVITSLIPISILSVVLFVLFAALLIRGSVQSGLVVKLDLTLLVVVILQLALYLFNFITHFSNLSHGLLAFLYVQIALVVIAAVSVLLFALAYVKNRRTAL